MWNNFCHVPDARARVKGVVLNGRDREGIGVVCERMANGAGTAPAPCPYSRTAWN